MKEGSRCGRTRRRHSPPHLPRVAWSTHRPPIHPIAYVHASQVWRAREHPTSGRGVIFLTHIDIAVRSRRQRSIYATAVTPSHRVPLYHYQPGPARSSPPLLNRPLPDDDIDCRCCGCVRLDPHLADDRLLIGHPTPSPYTTLQPKAADPLQKWSAYYSATGGEGCPVRPPWESNRPASSVLALVEEGERKKDRPPVRLACTADGP